MKRIISLVLAIALLCSFVPVALAETATPALSFELGTVETKTYTPYEGSETTYYSVPVSVKNNSTARIKISTYECYLKFDGQSLEAVPTTELENGSFIRPVTNGERPSTLGWGLPTAGVSKNDSNCFGAALANNSDTPALAVNAGASVVLFWANFIAAADAEKGLRTIQFAKDSRRSDGALAINFASYYDSNSKTTTDYSEANGALTCTNETTVNVISGKTPVLTRAEIVAEDGVLETAYGASKAFTLKAYSAKNTVLSEDVSWEVSPKDGISIAGTTLTVSDTAAVGEYTVTAKTKDNDKCVDGETPATATFKVTPATITNPTVTITGFGKGATVSAAAASVSNGLTYGNDIKWYKDNVQVTEGNFAGSSTYKAVFTLSADSNHQLAANSTVTVNGVADEYVLSKELTAPDANGKYTVTLTLKTADKDTLAVLLLPTPSKASYGMTLKDVTLTGGTAMVYGDPNQTPVAGEFRWVDENESVGIPTVGTSEVYGRPFKLKFVPTDNVNYAELETTMRLHVYQATISIDAIKNWNYGTVIPYDGTEHTVELVIPDDTDKLYDKLTVDYTNDETNCNSATNVGKYTALAEIKVKAEESAYYAIYESDHTTRTLDWEIVQGTLSAENKTVGVRYSTPSKTLTLAELGLSALANEPGVDISFDVSGKGDVISSAGLTRDAEEKITGISLTLQDTDVNSIGKTGSVKLTITSKNYATKELTVTVEIINKDTKTLTVTGPASFPYGTTAETIKNALTVTGLPTGYDASKVTYTFSNSDISTVAPAEGYKVTVGYEDDNFLYSGEYTFEITARSIADADVTFKALTYNGSEQTTDITVKLGEKTLTKVVDYTVTGDLKGTNAGEYTVTVSGTGNYTGTKEATFTIDKADLSGATITLNSTANMVYDGTPKTTLIAVTFDGNSKMTPTEGVDYTAEFSDNINASENAKVTITAKPNSNYTGSKTQTFTINKAKVTVTDIAAQDKTYDGTNTAKITGTLTGVLEKDKDNVTLNAPAATFASKDVNVQTTGTWTAQPQPVTVTEGSKFTLSGSAADNYEISPEPDLTNLTATINFKTLALTEAQRNLTVDVRYTDLTEHSVSLPVPEGLIEGDVVTNVRISKSSDPYPYNRIEEPTYNSENGSIKFRLASETEETASVKYLISLNYGSNYYNTLNLTLYINISIRSAQSPLTYTGATSVVYGQSITLTSAGGSGTGAVTYAIVSGGDGAATISGNVLTATKAGTVKIQVTKAGDNDYLSTTSAVYDITVTKATPATPPEIKVDNTDTTLGELGNKMLVGIGVPGTINWYGPDGKLITKPHNTKIEANTEYRWTFIPEDTKNYNPIEGKTTPYVRDDLSWLPGVLGGGSSFSFHDVTRFDYYYDSVKWAADNGIASGTSRFTFSPDAVCTRAQTVTFLWRAAGSPLPRYRVSPFTDVHSYDYYYEAVLWAVEQGITTGLTATTFGPDETVTRGQVATFLYRAASAAKPNTFNPFTDVKPTAYNYGAILWAYDNRITTGTSTTTFSPDAFCTRAQIVTFLYRYYQGR